MKNKLIGLIALMAFSCVEEPETITLQRPSSKTGKQVTAPGPNGRIDSYTFKGDEGGPLPLETATQWIRNYRDGNPDQLQAHFFGNEIIKQLLAEEGCVGIRIYYALDENGQRQLLLVGTDSKGEDLLPAPGGRTDEGGNIIADYSLPCPSYCGSGFD